MFGNERFSRSDTEKAPPAGVIASDLLERMRDVSGTGEGASPEQIARGFDAAAQEQGDGVYAELGVSIPDSEVDTFTNRVIRGEYQADTLIGGSQLESQEIFAPTPDNLAYVTERLSLNPAASPQQIAAAFTYEMEIDAQRNGGSAFDDAPLSFPLDEMKVWAKRVQNSN